MSSLDKELAENQLARILIYGAAKTKKTWWAGTAAEAGFNVLMLDGEGGIGTLKNLSAKARKRILVYDIQDTASQAKMAIFMARFCKMKKFWWNEEKKMPNGRPAEGFNVIDVSVLTANDVVVLDSYTALVWSLAYRYATENNIDLSDANKQEWEGYGWAGNLATWMLHQLKTLPCHFIMVAHADQYDRYSKKDKTQIEFSRTQIKSTSRPHAMQIGNLFDDIYHFTVKGSAFKIDTTSGTDRDGGCRLVAPKSYAWEKLPFAEVCRQAGIALPVDAPPLVFRELPNAEATPNANTPVDATGKSRTISLKPAGKSSLLGKLRSK